MSTRSSSIIPIAGEYYNKVKSTYTAPIIKRLSSSLISAIKKTSKTDKRGKAKLESSVYSSAADIWESNISLMNAVALSKGSKYITVLQPTLGLNIDDPKYKSKMGRKDIEYFNKIRRDEPGYIYDLNNLYAELRGRCSKINYCLDLSNN